MLQTRWADNSGDFRNQSAGALRSSADCSLEVRSNLLDRVALVHEISHDGALLRVNDRLCLHTGFSAERLIGSTHEIINSDVAAGASWLSLHNESAPGELWTGETQNRRADGSDLSLSSTIIPQRGRSGEIVSYVCASIDITESSRLRDEFDRNGKLMQLGQLTATVAHEIRNPLGAIRTANYVLERKLKGRVEGVEAQLERINNGIGRCDKIITELLDFSRRKAISLKACAVDEWVSETVAEESKTLTGAPEIMLDLGLGTLETIFDQDQMRQVLINLLSNAAEAIGEKIKLGAPADYRPRITVHTRREGDLAKIVVQDNGPGISPNNLQKIREPLFTTKSFGVGLGIPAIEKILENHGGSLTIESEHGFGAEITANFLIKTGAPLSVR